MFTSGLARALSLLGALCVVNAAPTLEARQSITTLTAAQISAFKPFSYFAAVGYCNPSQTLAWNCGAKCNANAGFIPVASGGNGGSIQFWYVGYAPAQASVIVGYQGTDADEIESIGTDINIVQRSLPTSLFPGISSDIKVHDGFGDAHARSASAVLAAVQKAIAAHSAKKVTLVGHSLGGALALLSGVYLPLHISGVSWRVITYGQPRVGNDDFADYVDSKLGSAYTHINNKKDLIPILPGRGLGYAHASGEVHITTSGSWVSCPGQDNTNAQCTIGTVPNIFVGDLGDHSGPFDGVDMGC